MKKRSTSRRDSTVVRQCPCCGFETNDPAITDHTHYDNRGLPYVARFVILVKDKYAKRIPVQS